MITSIVAAFAIVAFVAPVQAQSAEKIYRIGYIHWRASPFAPDKAFVHALRDLGWIEGKNIVVEYRWDSRRRQNLPAVAAELARRNVDVLVTGGPRDTAAAIKATSTIPIVMLSVSDAVENRLIASLARPGGNVTGVSPRFTRIFSKLLELLLETMPKATRVVFLGANAGSPYLQRYVRAVEVVARSFGTTIHSLPSAGQGSIHTVDDLNRVLDKAVALRADALMVAGSLYARRKGRFAQAITDFAVKNRMPVVSTAWILVKTNFALLGFGPDYVDTYRQAATYVDKILKGKRPADLPVQQPRKFKLVVNLKVAKRLGLTVHPSIMVRATDVIE